MATTGPIDWRAEHDRFMAAAYRRTVASAHAAFSKWPRRKRDDAVAEMVAKMWDQWARLLMRGRDPVPMIGPLIHWAKLWVRYDRKVGGRARRIDVYDFRAGMRRRRLSGRGRASPTGRSDHGAGWRLGDGDDPAEMVAALDEAGLTWAAYLVIRAEEDEDPGGRGAVSNPDVPRTPGMKPEKAKRQLEKMLLSFTPGSVLMLQGEVLREMGREAREGGSEVIADNYEVAESSLSVLGLGLDALLPKPKGR